MSPGRRGSLARARPDLVGVGVTGLLATLLTGLYYRLWDARPGISWAYEGDGLGYQAVIQGVLEGHWALHNDRLGFPFGQHTSAYPLPDHVSLGLAKLLGAVTGAGSAPVTNLYFFATFPLVAVAAYAALRWLGTRRDVTVVLAVLYAFAPYHLERGGGHLFLSFYVLVPLGTAVLIRQLTGHAVFVDSATGRFGRPTASAWAAVAVAAGLALTGVYYALFFCVIAAGVAVVLALRGRSGLHAAASTLGLALVTGLVLVVALAPALLASDGTHVERPAAHSEMFGLRVARLVLPGVDHRIEALSAPAEELRGLPVAPGADGTAPLGVVAAVGFLGSLLLVLSGRGSRDTQGAAATIAMLTTLIGAAAGFGLLAASLGFTQIRAWNRISIYIAFACLVVVAGWIDRWLGRAGRARWVAPAGLAVLLVLGLLDQVPGYSQDGRDATIATWQRDESFFHELEADLPAGAAVFQLPVVPYPEEPSVGGMIDYDHLRGYLHTDDLRWSYGYTKLSQPPWDRMLTQHAPREVVVGAALAGFDAIYLNRDGYAKQRDPEAMVRALVDLLGEPITRSDDGRMLAWDLRPVRERLADELDPAELEAARADVIDEVWVRGGEGFYAGEGPFQWLEGADGELVVQNRTSDTADVSLRLELSGVAEGEVELRYGDLVREVAVVPDRRTVVTLPLEVEPDTSTISVHTTIPPDESGARDRTAQLFTPVVEGGTDLAAIADAVGLP